MKLKLLDIYNYRQFIHESIYMEDGITFLAGANNSGKTSVIQNMKQGIEKDFLKSADDYKDVYGSVKKCVEEIDSKFGDNVYYKYCYQDYYQNGIKGSKTHKYVKNYANIGVQGVQTR